MSWDSFSDSIHFYLILDSCFSQLFSFDRHMMDSIYHSWIIKSDDANYDHPYIMLKKLTMFKTANLFITLSGMFSIYSF